ncbi:ArsR family transcriptional regulator [Pseudomonas protegens]|uniref:VpaChn25_0724 family phage protein n=1 Tax=Pseudomonas protegens TaxID=380021 RepID=UPI00287DB586|nr:ArsR family transcriptional regulator [Pseudomonas protegens]MDS9879385.1 ArsR family transcriptional regulator [Pseudomonas protegens]
MTQYAAFLREDYRLVILRLPVETTGYRANSSVLTMALDSFGHTLSRDQVKTELHWLAEQGAITVSDVGPVLVATLTERGQDIAAGRARVPGIKRPGA